ncbi:oxidoreductase [Hymenopellis radicata]|nr:oxidoreductase [Hymenopellis radicata]
MLFSKKWNPSGLQHVYVTGGSQGLGLAFAMIVVQKGAHVSIVARDEQRLKDAEERLKEARISPNQQVHSYSYNLGTASESTAALGAACVPFGGQAPDVVVACAGASYPAFFVEMDEDHMERGMRDAYWVEAWTAWAASKLMVKQKRTGKIVLVSSILGYLSFIGHTSYAPGKHALRALGDALHSELMLYGIDVHTFFPPTMYTALYEAENVGKPKVVLDIEGTDEGQTAEYAAQQLYRGIVAGNVHITGDLLSGIFRAGTRGATPKNNWVLDAVLDFISFMFVPVWRASVDRQVRRHSKDHEAYLREKGFFT